MLSTWWRLPNSAELATCRQRAVSDLSCETRCTTCCRSTRSMGWSRYCKSGTNTAGTVGSSRVDCSFSRIRLSYAIKLPCPMDGPFFRLGVSCGRRQMHQAEVFAEAVQRLGVPQQQVPVGQQIGVEVLQHLLLGSGVKVDQHVAAQDQIQSLHEGHARAIEQI